MPQVPQTVLGVSSPAQAVPSCSELQGGKSVMGVTIWGG
jgi:hypothetical protein